MKKILGSASASLAAFTLLVALPATSVIAASTGPSAGSFDSASSDTSSWILPGHDYSANRYVDMKQISPANVATLKRAWRFKIPDDSPIEAQPIVWNGMIYLTSAHDNVYAVDAKTGDLKWTFSDSPHVIAFAANRGVAILDGKLFLGTLDGHLISLDAATGKKIWDVVGVHDPTNSFYTMQPVVYKNMLLMGVSNGDWGGLGYITALSSRKTALASGNGTRFRVRA